MGSSRDETDQPRCDICGRDSFPESILSCHRCITVQHTFCLPEPLVGLPVGRWLCPACSQSSRRSYPSRRRAQSTASTNGGGLENGTSGTVDEARGDPSARSSRASGVVVEAGARVRGASGRRKKAGGAAAAPVEAGSAASAPSSSSAAVVSNGVAATARSCPPRSKRARRGVAGGSRRPAVVEDEEGTAAVAAEAEVEAAGHDARAPGGQRDCSASSQNQGNGVASSDTERERLDPGSTITIFCRRDFRRYLRWKQRELASQDDERRKEEQTRARKTFSSIIAANTGP